ncbi:MAG: hypothetical protein N2749_00720 [Clostridia bacterium]|nr:hypothetical protein [Clostridia bacterium]
MPYIEPGVYLKAVSNLVTAGGFTPALTPLVIGSGATILKRTEVITRSTESYDVLPTNAVDIKLVGYTEKKNNFVKGTDYTFDPANPNKITWLSGGNNPANGEKYTVIYTYEVNDEQFVPRLITSLEDIEKYYGTDIKTEEGGDINRIALALRIVLGMGAKSVYALQVKPNKITKKVTAVEYQEALDKYAKFINDVWRIVPVDLDDNINGVIDAHARTMSGWEERMERCVVYGKKHDELTSFDDVLATIGGYATSKSNKRATVIYPDKATMLLDDGAYHEVDAPFIAAAYAGLEASLPVQQSKTRSKITIFNELKGIKMTRTQKNALAEKGVMILEQPYGPGTDIIIRHQLTTDMTNAQTRENSLLGITDYCSKYLRTSVEQYIGKYNITPDTISRVKGSLSSALSQLTNDGVIISGVIKSLAQDVNNPDTLLVEVEILPPYPCNYIKITLYVD